MAETQAKSKTSRRFADLLADGIDWSLGDRLRVIRSLAIQVRALHEQGLLHRGICADAVRIDDRLDTQLSQPAAQVRLGGAGGDPEFCPPEMMVGPGVELPAQTDAAAAALQEGGYGIDPRRIDVYQLGTLLCRLLTGESILGYMYDPVVKGKVPAAAKSLLQQALGDGDSQALADCYALIAALDESLRQLPVSKSSTSERDTPAGGSVIGAASDTPRHGHRARAAKQQGSDLPFERLGHFRIMGQIGSGGMGDVYRGRDESLDRDVAVKVLPPELARDEDFVRRFQAEASAAGKLSHPNVVPVYFIGEDAGYHFFAMRLIDGEPLSARLDRQGALPLEEALALVEKCLAGLQAAHEENLIHRDIKPGNILLERETGEPVLVDFGLVRRTGQQTRMTATGMVMGTVDYMAPEQARGHKIDCRADIYALGVLFYQTLAGRLPFDADTPTGMIFQHAYEDPLPLSRWVPDLPEPIVEITARMMAKNRDERYASCEDVLADIEAFREGRTLAPPPQQGGSRSRKTSGPKSCDSGYEDGDPTSEMPAADDVELPADLDELADDSPLRRVRDLAATMFRRHAPEFVQNLQSTTQQVDGAVGHYERRRNRFAKLDAEARAVAADLSEQLQAGEKALSSADQLVEVAGSEEDREAALTAKERAEEDVDALRRQVAAQQGQIEEIAHELTKADATLARLRSQRDVLQARLKSAHARGQIEGGQAPADRRRWLVPLAAIACLAALVPVCLLLILPRSERPPIDPETEPPAVNRTTPVPPVTGVPAAVIDVPHSVPAPPVDLLSMVDVDRDVLQGQWHYDGPVLVAESIESRRHNLDRVLQFPVLLPEQYDIEFEVQPVAGHPSFGIGLVLGGKRCLTVLGGGWGNEHFICGVGKREKDPSMPRDRPCTVRCEVRRSGTEYGVRVLFDGGEVFLWRGDPKQLNAGQSFHFTLPADNRVPFLRFREGIFHVHRITLTPVSGDVRPLELDSPSDSPDRVAALRALWKGGDVWISISGQPPVKIEGPANLPPTFALTRIGLRDNFAVTDADLATFRGLTDLIELDLANTFVTDAGVGQLAELPQLKHLDLSSTLITDAALTALGHLDGLCTLSLQGTRISGEGLQHLAGFGQLERLDLRQTYVADQGLENLRPTSALTQLLLDGTFVTDAGVAALPGIGRLSRLSLTGTDVSDAAVSDLKQLGGLESLSLFGTRITKEGVDTLREALADGSVASDFDETVNLLPLVETLGEPVKGDWRFEQRVLLSPSGSYVRIQVPYVPPQEYVLEAVVERKSDSPFALGLVGGGRQFVYVFDASPGLGYLSGIDRLDNKVHTNNESKFTGQVIPEQQPVTLAVTVLKSGISISRNGELLTEWQGDFSRCTLHPRWRIPRTDTLFVAAHGNHRITSLRLTPLSDKGQVVTPMRADAVSEKNTSEMLNWVHVTQHSVRGTWVRGGRELVSPQERSSLMMIPAELRGSYQLDVDFTPNSGNNLVAFVLPVGDHACSVAFSVDREVWGGIGLIDGKPIGENGTARKSNRLAHEQRFRAKIQVELLDSLAAVRVFLDGRRFTQWIGDPGRLSLGPPQTLPRPGHVGLYTDNSQITFHRVRFTPFDSMTARASDTPGVGYELTPHPPEAVRIGDHWYQLISEKLTWDKAKARCEELGGYLCCLETPEENRAIRLLIAGRQNVWLGGYRRPDTGWFWLNGLPITWFDWEPNNPSNREDCLEIMTNAWNDESPSSWMSNGFVCEWEL